MKNRNDERLRKAILEGIESARAEERPPSLRIVVSQRKLNESVKRAMVRAFAANGTMLNESKLDKFMGWMAEKIPGTSANQLAKSLKAEFEKTGGKITREQVTKLINDGLQGLITAMLTSIVERANIDRTSDLYKIMKQAAADIYRDRASFFKIEMRDTSREIMPTPPAGQPPS
jgi:hypothetical protein